LELLELSKKIINWRNDLKLFFKDITGYIPSNDQSIFLNDLMNLSIDRIILSAARGTGKTLTLALLSLWYTYILPQTTPGIPMKVVVLGGSFEQSSILYNYVKSWILSHTFILNCLETEPIKSLTKFKDGSSIKALTASEKQVRGPHADLLIIDEAVEAGDDLIKTSFQIVSTSQYPRIIISSTPHQYHSLFVKIWNSPEYNFKKYNWKAINCSWIKKSLIEQAKNFLDTGTFQIEWEGLPYSFTGLVFQTDLLRKCLRKEIIPFNSEETYRVAGIDWGHYPNPTVLTIIEREKDKVKVLYSQEFLKEKFEDVLNQIELIVKSYNVVKINTDSTDIGENQRLASRGLPVYPIKFKTEKSALIHNLQALIEKGKIEIHEDNYPLINQMRIYRFDTKKGEDYVDSLLLACKSEDISPTYNLSDLIYIKRKTKEHTRESNMRWNII